MTVCFFVSLKGIWCELSTPKSVDIIYRPCTDHEVNSQRSNANPHSKARVRVGVRGWGLGLALVCMSIRLSFSVVLSTQGEPAAVQ